MLRELKKKLARKPEPTELKSGDAHYRAYVGPPEYYDQIAALQCSLLFTAGIRENHNLLDLGCGSLRGGRLLIPYLQPGHYYGIEPNRWLVEEGIREELGQSVIRLKRPRFRYVDDFSAAGFGVEFDYVLAQSVFSHTHPDLMMKAFRGIGDSLALNGVMLATFIEGEPGERGAGWEYPGVVPYRFEEVAKMAEEAGLGARRIHWPHPFQRWFIAALPSGVEHANYLSERIRPPLDRDQKPAQSS